MADSGLGLWGVPLAVLGGAIRVSTPFMFVSLGECLTERVGPHQPRARGHPGDRRHERLRACRIGTGSPWLGVLVAAGVGAAAGRAARRHLPAAAGQRHRHRHRADAVRHRPRVLPRQALHPAEGAATCRRSTLGWWSDIPQVRQALQVNALFLLGIVLAVALAWALTQHALGPDRAHGRRKRRTRRAPWAYSVDRVRTARDHGRRLPRRHRRRVPVALLPRQLERRPVERPGPDGGGAGDLRALESAALSARGAAVRRRRRARARRCSRSASPRATISSAPRPTC